MTVDNKCPVRQRLSATSVEYDQGYMAITYVQELNGDLWNR